VKVGDSNASGVHVSGIRIDPHAIERKRKTIDLDQEFNTCASAGSKARLSRSLTDPLPHHTVCSSGTEEIVSAAELYPRYDVEVGAQVTKMRSNSPDRNTCEDGCGSGSGSGGGSAKKLSRRPPLPRKQNVR
jgi:hypothetical protein